MNTRPKPKSPNLLPLIRKHQPVSSAKLAELTGRSVKVVRSVLNKLKQDGLIRDVQVDSGRRYAEASWEEPLESMHLRMAGSARESVDGCLIWQGSCNPGSGPIFFVNGGKINVRRHLYECFHRLLKDNERIRNTCGNNRCLSFDCMAVVSHGSWARGAVHSLDVRIKNALVPRARKLTPAQKIEIQTSAGSHRQKAIKYGVSTACIGRIMLNDGKVYRALHREAGMFTGLMR